MLFSRLKVAIPLILLLFLIFYLPGSLGRLLFTMLAAAAFFLAIGEIVQLSEFNHRKAYALPIYFLGAVLFVLSSLNPESIPMLMLQWSGEILVGILFLLTVFCLSFYFGIGRESIRDVNAALTAAFYICWPLCFLLKIYFLSNGALLLGYLILVTKIADTGAYFVGTGTAKLPGGNHKLAKAISPKKSWEGLVGGVVFSLAASLIFFHIAQDHLHFRDFGGLAGLTIPLTRLDAILLGIVAAPVGLLGDLAESAIKRAANAKDSGQLPGLGGILDTLDSLLPMGPLFYAWLILKNAIAISG